MPPPNCSTRHARSFEVSQTSHFRGSLTLRLLLRQMRQLSGVLDSCIISASYEVSQMQTAILVMPRTAKDASTSSEELNTQISHAQMMNIFFQLMKTVGKSTSGLESTSNRDEGAMRDVLLGYLSPLPHSNRFGTVPSSKHR